MPCAEWLGRIQALADSLLAAELHEPNQSLCWPATTQRCCSFQPQDAGGNAHRRAPHTTLAVEQKGAHSQVGRDLFTPADSSTQRPSRPSILSFDRRLCTSLQHTIWYLSW